MTYIVIEDDQAATLRIEPAPPTIGLVEKEVREMGWDRTYPRNQRTGVVGWVSDVGMIMPEFGCNVVGSCVMAALSAPVRPLCGPLVITGYAFDEGGWPEPLDETHLKLVGGIYVAVLDALGRDIPEAVATYNDFTRVPDEGWRDGVRLMAAEVTRWAAERADKF